MTDAALKKLDECFDELLAEENERAAAGKRTAAVTPIDYTGVGDRGTVALKAAEQISGGNMGADRVRELTALKAELSKSFDEAMVTLNQKLAAAQAEQQAASGEAEKAVVREAGKRSMAEGILLAREFPKRGGPPE